MKTRKISLNAAKQSEYFRFVKASTLLNCWTWRGKKNGRLPYGLFSGLLAHRVMWTIVVGPIPPGLEILHNCDNPPCVNPFHLKAGTHAQNMGDAAKRGRMPRGEARPLAKLTDEKVRELRDWYRQNLGKQRVWKYHLQTKLLQLRVNITTAHRAATGRTWKHIENPVRIPGYNRRKP